VIASIASQLARLGAAHDLRLAVVAARGDATAVEAAPLAERAVGAG
jgi:hypothetical protein